MEKPDEFTNLIDECMKLLDENVDVLSDIKYSLDSQKEDLVKTGMTKNDLVEMAEEVADLSRIKKAESGFIKRYFEKNLS